MNVYDKIVDYENGDLNEDEVVEFFQYLIDNDMINKFQGHYQRMARFFIEEGLCKIK